MGTVRSEVTASQTHNFVSHKSHSPTWAVHEYEGAALYCVVKRVRLLTMLRRIGILQHTDTYVVQSGGVGAVEKGGSCSRFTNLHHVLRLRFHNQCTACAQSALNR